MRPFVRTVETTEFDGGWLCLDFINTVKSRFENPTKDYLTGSKDWLIWSRRQKLISKSQVKEIELELKNKSKIISSSFKKIIDLREELYQVFKAISGNKKPPINSLQYVNKSISFCFKHYSLELNGNKKPVEHFSIENDPLLTPLLLVIKSTYDLLRSDKLLRIKECENCGWLFLDRSKNNSRKWCNMQTCGSSKKAKRYYYKIKKESD